MRKKTIIISQILIASVLLVAYFINGCEQAPINCQVGRGYFYGKFFPNPENQTIEDACNIGGQEFVFHTYYHATDPNDPQVDYEAPIFAIQPTALSGAKVTAGYQGIEDENADHSVYSLGDFDSATPTNNVCTVSSVNDSELTLPEIWADKDLDSDGDAGPVLVQPAMDISYKWSNIRVLVTTAWIGNAVTADLEYTDNLAGCTATYSVQFLLPEVGCADPKTGEPDVRYCSPEAIDGFSAVGSGISPDFDVVCDEDLLMCVLNTLPPDLQQ